jgi:hypothetical protein
MRRLIARLIEHVVVQRTNWSRAFGEPSRLGGRFLGTLRRLSGNVGKHSLECFAPGHIGVLRFGFLALRGRFRVGRLHFLRNHRNTIHIYEGSKR